jgi:uncharacterized membrane protein (UPF0127 family)
VSLAKLSRLLLIVLTVILSASCTSEESDTLDFATTPLTIETTGGALELTVEVADTPDKQSQGLMDRQTLDEDAGMIFVFSDEAQRSFWMQNTYVSLDMLFLSSAKEILYIAENTTPLSTDIISPDVAAQYVLEVNAGYSARHGVNVGDQLSF